MWLKHARKARLPAAVVFADLRKAYYSVVVCLALGTLDTETARGALFAQLALGPDAEQRFQRFRRGGYAHAAGMPPGLAKAIGEFHIAPHFVVQGGASYVQHDVGTRPGNVLADLVFAFCFGEFYAELLDALDAVGLLPTLSMKGHCLLPGPVVTETIAFRPPAYMDDFFVPVAALDADALVAAVAAATRIILRTAARFGLQLNLEAGKTEAVLAPRGPGTRHVKRRIFLDGGICVDGHILCCAGRYNHLGTLATATGAEVQEIAARIISARAAENAARRPILMHRDYTHSTKVMVTGSLVYSRLFVASGLWEPLPRSTLRGLRTAYLSPLRRVLWRPLAIPTRGARQSRVRRPPRG